jgi:MFS family permease
VRSKWWAELLEPSFVALTEGIWIVLLYALIELVGGASSWLGLLAFVVVAFVGAVAGPWLDRLGTARWQAVGLVALIVAAAGMLVAPGVLGAMVARDPGAAFGAHPGGWLLGVGAFRGMVGAGRLDDPDRASRPYVRGVIVLTLIWLYAGLLPVADQVAFRATAIGPTLLFATVGIAAVGLHRVHAIAAPAGIAWWRNRAWLATLAILVALLALGAVPVAIGLTRTIPGILGLAGFPEIAFFGLYVVWLILPRDGPRRPRTANLRVLLGLAIVLAVGAIGYRLLHGSVNLGSVPAGAASPGESSTSNGLVGVVIVVAILLVIGLLALVLARNPHGPAPAFETWPAADDSGFEVERPSLGWLRRARDRLFGSQSGRRPVTAEGAYLAMLNLLEPLSGLRRLADETPQGHARRLRRAGHGTIELDLLAADYELSRWGARQLPVRERDRAIDRWQRSRGWIADLLQAEEVARQLAAQRERSGPA